MRKSAIKKKLGKPRSSWKNRKLGDKKAAEIKAWLAAGYSLRQIGQAYGVSHVTILAIDKGRTYKEAK